MASKGRGCDSVVGVLRRWSVQSADKTALIYEARHGEDSHSSATQLSYSLLDHKARCIAATLQAEKLAGKRVLLLAQGIPFTLALLGCFYAGAIPVPGNQPRAHTKHWQRLQTIVDKAELAAVIGEFEFLATLRDAMVDLPALSHLRLLSVEHLESGDAAGWQEPQVATDQTALIQFTSGSTGTPRGVMVSHDNLLHNLGLIQQATHGDRDSVMVSWLPLFHDMGLMGGLLHPLVMGASTVLFSPMDFVRRPARWLRMISKHGATISGGPNFAYAFATQRIKERELTGLDLSSWRAAFCGAEPVHAETLRAFAHRFADYGFDPGSLMPCYGMAEATLFISGSVGGLNQRVFQADRAALQEGRFEAVADSGHATSAPVDEAGQAAAMSGAHGQGMVPARQSNSQTLVSCGRAQQFMDVVIADPQTGRALPADRVGEIWIGGPSVSAGYWHDEAANRAQFQARLVDSNGELLPGCYLRSGDLGLIHADQLIITGRLKDLIIIRGRNYYPYDLEWSTNKAHPDLAANAVAALGIATTDCVNGGAQTGPRRNSTQTPGEMLVLVAEVRRGRQTLDTPAIFNALREALALTHDVVAAEIILVAPGSLLRTSSGKVRRADIKHAYLHGQLNIVARSSGIDDAPLAHQVNTADTGVAAPVARREVIACVAEIVEQAPATLAADRPLAALGMDSLRAALLSETLEQRLGYRIGVADVLAARDINELLQRLTPIAEPNANALAGTLVSDARARHRPFPLTDMQQAYWVGRRDLFELGGRSLHGYVEVQGDVDLVRFEQAWNTLIREHDMLRAVVDANGEQCVLPQVPHYTIAVDDLRECSGSAREQQLSATRERMSHQCLDVQNWPAFEIRASRLTTGVRLHFSIDGLFLDFRSFQLLFRELIDTYHGRCRQGSSHIPGAVASDRAAPSFRDYVQWLAQQRDSADYRHAHRYWRQQLAQLPVAPQLPLACDPAQLRSPRVTRRQFHLPAARWQRLRQRAADHGITAAALLLTAYGKVLARWSEDQRLTLNVPLFNRPAGVAGVDQVIGNFSSFTLVAMDFTRPQGFAEQARAVQQELHRAMDHSAVSGVQLLRELSRQRGQVSGRTFPVVFTYLPTGVDAADDLYEQIDGGLGRLIYSVTQTPQVWLDNQIWHERGGLRIHWDGIDALFPSGVADEMFAAYSTLLEQLAMLDQHWHAAGVDLLPAWQQRLIAESNRQCQTVPTGTVVDWIQARAQQQPTVEAVVDQQRRMTYRELLDAADALAMSLHQRGLSRNDRIAVVLEKGWRQVVAVLGIQRLGAAYVPLDCDAPEQRLQRVLADCQACAVICEPQHRERFAAWVPLALCLDQPMPATNVTHLPMPQRDDLAYIIYTSGTTGTPKGVMVTHDNVAQMVAVTQQRFALSPQDRILNITALHHDLSVFDVFAVLAAGGCVVLPEHGRRVDPSHWLSLLQRERVTLWNSVPALLEMLLSYAENLSAGENLSPGDNQLPGANPPAGESAPALAATHLRQAWIGGDWVSAALIRRARRCLPQMAVCSIGGPTETTVWNVWYPIPDALPDTPTGPAADTAAQWPVKIPYGKPIPNNQYYILNNAGEACPVWVPGELYCAGAGVSLGYWNKAHETARRFVCHPETGERLYRSGDFGRWLPDGNIEFMGRRDHQLKIQGVRIEAGEIEACLLRHCAVQAALVGSVGQGAEKALAAWVVPASHSAQADDTAQLLAQVGPVTTDVAERITFKLEQHGIRNVRGAATALPGRPQEINDRDDYLARQSLRRFLPCPLSAQQLGEWLAALAQLRLEGKMLPKYRYPSGGGLYPVQTYLYIRQGGVEGLAAGYYYYHPVQHQLVCLHDAADDAPIAAPETVFGWQQDSAFQLWLVADLNAIEPLYGQLARDFCLLEAGYMSQLLMERASAQSIGVCPLGLSDNAALHQALQLQSKHQVLHSMVGGHIDPLQLSDWLSEESSGVNQAPAPPPHERILETLRQHLPISMVPRHVILIDRLPLTANGKVDRQALPQPRPAALRQFDAAPATSPDTPLEAQLLALWQELLNLERVGLDDNFFSAGGNSNLLIQAHARIQATCGRAFPVADLFKYPTIRQLAEHLTSDDKESSAVADTAERGRKQREALRRHRSRKATKHV